MKNNRGSRRIAAVLLMMLSILFTGCSGEKPILENLNREHVPTALEAYNGNEGMIAEDEQYYYLVTAFRLYAIHKETWEVQKACRDAMCAHNMDCAYSGMPVSVVNVKGNMLLAYSNRGIDNYYDEKSLYRLDTLTMELERVYQNEFTFSGLQNCEEQLIYSWYDNEGAKSGTRLLNLQTGESVQLADKGARIRYDDSYFYINTTNEGGLYRLSRDMQETVLLDNRQVSAMQLEGEYVYYTYYDPEYAAVTLGRISKDRKEMEALIPEVWNWFHVYQGKVYYTEQKTNNLCVLDLETKEKGCLAENVTFMFYLLPDADKLIFNQDGTYSSINLDGSGLKELFYEPSEFTSR